MNAGLSFGDVVAILALFLSGYATWRTHRFRKQEAALIDLQKKINDLVLKKEEREAAQVESADLGANFVTLGTKSHRLRIFNKGPATAYDVDVEFPGGNELVLDQDVKDKLPLESMERGQSVDLLAAVSMGSTRKMSVGLSWRAADGQRHQKIVHVTL